MSVDIDIVFNNEIRTIKGREMAKSPLIFCSIILNVLWSIIFMFLKPNVPHHLTQAALPTNFDMARMQVAFTGTYAKTASCLGSVCMRLLASCFTLTHLLTTCNNRFLRCFQIVRFYEYFC